MKGVSQILSVCATASHRGVDIEIALKPEPRQSAVPRRRPQGSAGRMKDHRGVVPPGAQDADHRCGGGGLLEAGEARHEFAQ